MTQATIRKWCVRFFVLVVAISLISCWMLGGILTAPAHRSLARPSELPVVDVELASKSGTHCAAWYLRSPSLDSPNPNATIILAHPIRANRLAMLRRAGFFYRLGYSVLMLDLQAHGESGGEHITFGHLERHDITAAVAFVRQQTPQHKIAVLGVSLGGAAAVLASPLNVDALIIESVYPTIEEATQNRLRRRIGVLSHIFRPLLLAQLTLRLGMSAETLRPIDEIDNVGCPILVMSGARDEHTSRAETENMFAAAKEPKQLVLFPDAAHIDLHRHDSQTYERHVVEFLRKFLSSDRSVDRNVWSSPTR